MTQKAKSIAEILRQQLHQRADSRFQPTDPLGRPDSKTNAELLGKVLLEEALKGKQWAVEMYFAYIEGRPAVTTSNASGTGQVERKIDDLTRNKLNKLAEKHGAKIIEATVKPEAPAAPADAQPAGSDPPQQPADDDESGGSDAADDPAAAARAILDML